MDGDGNSIDALSDKKQAVLTKTGTGTGHSAGYLTTRPFIDYLKANENLSEVVWSVSNPPEGSLIPLDTISMGQYRAISAVTDRRVLSVVGTPDGDETVNINLDDVEQVEIFSDEKDTADSWIVIDAREGSLTLYDSTSTDLGKLQKALLFSVRSAKIEEFEGARQNARNNVNEQRWKHALNNLHTAQSYRQELLDLSEMYNILPDSAPSCVRSHIYKIGAVLDYQSCVSGAAKAEQRGELETAKTGYERAQQITSAVTDLEPGIGLQTRISRIRL